jgi:NAD+ synthase (glutamine-hydrolysing)
MRSCAASWRRRGAGTAGAGASTPDSGRRLRAARLDSGRRLRAALDKSCQPRDDARMGSKDVVLRVAIAQLENRVGDFATNVACIGDAMGWAEEAGADVLVLPELALTGYPLDDLVTHAGFLADADAALAELAGLSGRTTVVTGTVRRVPLQRHDDTQTRDRTITAAVLHDGEVRGYYDKVLLPTYSVFDEQRVFAAGTHPDRIWRLGDVIVGIAICEDAWSGDGPPEAQSAAGAQALLLPNASPFDRGKDERRLGLVRQVARRNGVPVVYVNSYGGVDDLVFDGGSLVVDGSGELCYRAPQFVADRAIVDLVLAPARRTVASAMTIHTRPLPHRPSPGTPEPAEPADGLAQVWQALVVGTRDYARRNGFAEAVVGVNGGTESAVTAALAVDALGADQVLCVVSPAGRTAASDLDDARLVAKLLGVRLVEIDLVGVVDELATAIGRNLDTLDDRGDERLVLRTRAAALWAVADEGDRLLLATGNKTELSVGTAVQGGDLVGHFAPLADCPKTLISRLAAHRNHAGTVIPRRILNKDVTAERADSVPAHDWAMIDEVLERYVERMQPLEDIPMHVADRDHIEWVARQVMDAELLRRLAPMGVRITGRAFGKDRRVPIAQAWRPRFVVRNEQPGPVTETGPAEEGPATGTEPPATHEQPRGQ